MHPASVDWFERGRSGEMAPGPKQNQTTPFQQRLRCRWQRHAGPPTKGHKKIELQLVVLMRMALTLSHA